MKCEDYVNLSYKPAKDDLVCEFFVEPSRSSSLKRSAGAVAAESSTGTWTAVQTEKVYVKKLAVRFLR